MIESNWFKKPKIEGLILRLLSLGVLLNGIVAVWFTLLGQLNLHNPLKISGVSINIHLVFGLSLIYLATLLSRRKTTAWLVVLMVYGFIVGFNINEISRRGTLEISHPAWVIQNLVLPLVIVSGLLIYRSSYKVKSDMRSFASALRFSAALLILTFAYGTTGFILMDQSDFRMEISAWGAAQRTIDQFDLTTAAHTIPYTSKARVFVDSLSVISTGALVYAGVALFQPLRAKLEDQTRNREDAEKLLSEHSGSSEDFFKLWPHDKSYYFDDSRNSFLAYKVRRGVALVVGDPSGDPKKYSELLEGFSELCNTNDWQSAFIHTEPKFTELYKASGYSLQKIGEEAVIDLEKFNHEVRRNKHFRNVTNRFIKQGYTTELLKPPHSQAILLRLKEISDDWLKQPGRSERGFMLGYHSDEYMEQSNVFVIKDDAGTIRGFVNQIPSYDKQEANYDLLRSTSNSLQNSNDFLLMGFISYLTESGYERLNIGLCPLAGMHSTNQDNTVIDAALRFLYANGDRLYSFSGLHRFKSKYEPEWTGRHIAYKGGLRGFTRVLNALNSAMKISSNLS